LLAVSCLAPPWSGLIDQEVVGSLPLLQGRNHPLRPCSSSGPSLAFSGTIFRWDLPAFQRRTYNRDLALKRGLANSRLPTASLAALEAQAIADRFDFVSSSELQQSSVMDLRLP
jgi:hypothetical protein